MSKYNTGNPVGSADPRDLYDNAENLDEAVNSSADTFQDRLGKGRLTWAGIVKAGTGDTSVAVDAADRAVAAAGQAENEADRAEDAAVRAENAEAVVDATNIQNYVTQAEAARDAAFVNADVYPDIATGRAAVADGEQFQVLSADGLEYIRYRKNSASTQTEVARFIGIDGSVTRAKLSYDFTYVGVLGATDDLNTQLKEGSYLTLDVPLNAPEGIKPNVLITIQNVQSRYIIQTIYDIDNSRRRWQRVIRFSKEGSFISAETWRDLNQVDRSGLADSFLYAGVLTSADDLNSLVKDGTYAATSTPINAPTGATGIGFISVSRAGVFVKQTFTHPHDASRRWQRSMQLTGGGAFAGGEWINLDPLSNVASQSELGVIKAGAGLNITADGTLSVITPSQDNPFAGKKIVCFGDSITEFKTYPQQLGLILGAEGINVGFGGCMMSAHWNDDYREMCMYRLADYIASGDYSGLIAAAQDLYTRTGDDNRAIVARLAAIDWNTVDYITILYGTNDYANGRSIGDATDVTPDGSNYLGSANYAIQQLQTTYPHLKIAMITPIYRARGANGGTDSDDSPNAPTDGKYLREYAAGLVEVAKLNHIPCFNLHDDSGINKYTASLYLNPEPDGVHLSEEGATFLAQKIAAKMRASF